MLVSKGTLQSTHGRVFTQLTDQLCVRLYGLLCNVVNTCNTAIICLTYRVNMPRKLQFQVVHVSGYDDDHGGRELEVTNY